MSLDEKVAWSLADGTCATPFDLLGMHARHGAGLVIRAFIPWATEAGVLRDSRRIAMRRVHPAGLFEAAFPDESVRFPYRLEASAADGHHSIQDDPYRFGPVLDATRLERLAVGEEIRIHQLLGSRTLVHEGVAGTVFAVWAPHARNVNLLGDFNRWDGRCHPMRLREATGVWELFIPGVGEQALYKYEIRTRDGQRLEKTDPVGLRMELRPATASVVEGGSRYAWGDREWMERRRERQAGDAPLAVYEVHPGSWRRKPGSDPAAGFPGWLSYRELADELLPYVKDLGYTHVELMPICEHPLDQSWGYQTVGYFAPTSRHGSPDEFRFFVDRAHQLGLGVLLDWVPAHFARDAHGLVLFDGTHLFEHEDPRRGAHPDWGTAIFDYGKPQVSAFLLSSALFWIEEYHLDGLRVDAVASMLYLDYSRQAGEWTPNIHGGRENLEAVDFVHRLNLVLHSEHPDVLTIAEESTAWPRVSAPVREGGLGFHLKWNMGWMHDTLEVMQKEPVYRRWTYDRLTFSMLYAFNERFLLPFSHDEVVHLKHAMLEKMPGEEEERFANLRLLYAYQYAHPGRKLLFMGGEFGVTEEWQADGELDWALASSRPNGGLRRLVRDLNHLYRSEPALHETDFDPAGFEWIDCHDMARTTLSFERRDRTRRHILMAVANFMPVAWEGFRLAVPRTGAYRIVLNTDAREYGGAGSAVHAEPEAIEAAAGSPPAAAGRPAYVEFTLPPLTMLYLKAPEPQAGE